MLFPVYYVPVGMCGQDAAICQQYGVGCRAYVPCGHVFPGGVRGGHTPECVAHVELPRGWWCVNPEGNDLILGVCLQADPVW